MSEEEIGDEEVLLIKPQKFMNLSGEAVQPLLSFFKLQRGDVVVVHDDLDLPTGCVRLRRGGSAAGHRGVEDIIRCLGGADFLRVRVGIDRPKEKEANNDEQIVGWVLGVPNAEESRVLSEAVLQAAQATMVLVSQGLEEAQRIYNRKGT